MRPCTSLQIGGANGDNFAVRIVHLLQVLWARLLFEDPSTTRTPPYILVPCVQMKMKWLNNPYEIVTAPNGGTYSCPNITNYVFYSSVFGMYNNDREPLRQSNINDWKFVRMHFRRYGGHPKPTGKKTTMMKPTPSQSTTTSAPDTSDSIPSYKQRK